MESKKENNESNENKHLNSSNKKEINKETTKNIPQFDLLENIINCHSDTITSISFTKNNSSNFKKLLATGSNDKFIKIFEINNNITDKNINNNTNETENKKLKEIWKYQYHIYGINKIKFSDDNKYLLSGGNDLQVNMVDVNSQSLLRNFRVDSIVTTFDINYSNNILAIGTYNNIMCLYDIRSRNCICRMICHSEPITDVKFSPDSTAIYSASYDSFFRIWDLFRFSSLKTFSLENSPSINNILLLENENFVLLNCFNSSLEILDIVNEVQIKKFTGHTHLNYCTDCCSYCYFEKNKQKDLIFTGDEECNLCFYNAREPGDNCQKISLMNYIKKDNNSKIPLVVNCLDIYNDEQEGKNNIIACSVMGDLNNSVLLFKQKV